uniref:Uncharacterized protein n=1 Tax=Anguilla anguilla TaxID=7936 RepID=A0A0E9TRL1_ANGAN
MHLQPTYAKTFHYIITNTQNLITPLHHNQHRTLSHI